MFSIQFLHLYYIIYLYDTAYISFFEQKELVCFYHTVRTTVQLMVNNIQDVYMIFALFVKNF